MKKKVIIIIFILILIIIGASTAVYFFINKPSSSEEELPKDKSKEKSNEIPKEEPPKEIPKEEPIDAKCRGEIEDSFYQFEDTPIIGSDILDNIKGVVSQFIRTIKQHIFKERFTLASTFITNKKLLDRNKTYYVGRRKVSNLISGPMYGGVNKCSEYPDLVYKEKITLSGKNNWKLIKGDFYGPYGGDWSDSNVKTKPYTLEQAQSYAESRGYDGITYNGNGTESGNQFFMWKSSSSNINSGGILLGWDLYIIDPTIPASKCTGSDCVVEGQKCLPGTEGSSGKLWVCTNKKWVQTIFKRKAIVDEGYPDNSSREFKRGWYDIIGQGEPNDYCRYVGDNPIYFACQLSDGSNVYATQFNGKNISDIVRKLPKPIEWKIYEDGGYSMPYRLNENGDIECMSVNNWDCYWDTNKNNTQSKVNVPPLDATKPNICSAGGYSDKNHWCYKGMIKLNPTSNKIPQHPCAPYGDNSTNVSQQCYNIIWKEAGCITPPATIGSWHLAQTKQGLINDSNAWATLDTETHRNGCYTSDRSKWPGSKIMYGPWIGPEQKAQAVKSLLTGEKVYMLYSPDGYTKMVTESGVAKYYVGGIEKFKASDWDSYANANGNYKLKDTPQPTNCTVSDWSGWSSCNQNAERTRTRSIITPESNGGVCPERNNLSETVRDVNACPFQVDESSCRYNVNYYSENWEACYKKGWTLDPSLWRYFDE